MAVSAAPVLTGRGQAMDTPSILMTISEAAAELRLSRSQLYGMTRRSEIPGVVRVGRAVRLHRETAMHWAKGQAETAENVALR